MPTGSLFPKPKIRLTIHQRSMSLIYRPLPDTALGKIPNGCLMPGGERIERGKKRMRIHATGGAYLNSRLTFIYLATFNFYGRDAADRLGPAGSSRCVVLRGFRGPTEPLV